MYFVGVVALADLRRSLMSGWVGRMGGWVGGEDGWQESGILQRIYVKVQQFVSCSFDCQIHFNTLPCGRGGWECGGVCTDGGTQFEEGGYQHVDQCQYRKTYVH